MDQYIFILGRDWELSSLELKSYLIARKIKFQLVDESDIGVILEMPSINATKMIKELGGIQKIGKILSSLDGLYNGKENKIRYGISNYTGDNNIRLDVKAHLKKQGIKATLKKSQQKKPFLTPSEAIGVVELIQYKNSVAKTIAIANPKDQKNRDEGRPFQPRLHKISLRLAKILVNLSGAKQGDSLLVPFSNAGTVVQEAIINGINATGIDRDPILVKGSQRNLEWIRKRYNPRGQYKILNGDSKDIQKLVKKTDYSVAFPPMGKHMKSYPTLGEAKKMANNLRPRYNEILSILGKITKRNIVLVSPRYKTKARKEVTIPISSMAHKLGLEEVNFTSYESPSSKIIFDIWVLSK